MQNDEKKPYETPSLEELDSKLFRGEDSDELLSNGLPEDEMEGDDLD